MFGQNGDVLVPFWSEGWPVLEYCAAFDEDFVNLLRNQVWHIFVSADYLWIWVWDEPRDLYKFIIIATTTGGKFLGIGEFLFAEVKDRVAGPNQIQDLFFDQLDLRISVFK